MQNRNHQYLVDKTESLEKGIIVFPSIYIEGSAASGKTTAVQMLLERHPDVEAVTCQMDKEEAWSDQFPGKLKILSDRMKKKKIWAVFENIPGSLNPRAAHAMAELVLHLPEGCRVIFISRDQPQQEFLELFWKRKMELISCENLFFTLDEIRNYAQHTGVALNPNEIYQKTGGWPGCVDVLIRLGLKNKRYGRRPGAVEELLGSYEMDAYIRREILHTLSYREREMMTRAVSLPWLNEKMCGELWQTQDALQLLNTLKRKNLLLYDSEKNRWKAAPLFCRYISGEKCETQKAGNWYEKNGHIGEALRCLRQSGNEEAYRTFLLAHYDRIPSLGVYYGEVMEWQEKSPEICYLRGMYSYSMQDMEGLDREIQSVRNHRPWDGHTQEIFLNLNYVKPDLHLNDWLQMLEDSGEEFPGIRLYDMLGNSVTFLCGLRDLSGLFACPKKEENRRARIWRECLGKAEWDGYRLARIDYYLETERRDAVPEEDWNFLMQDENAPESWQFSLAKLYLLCKLQRLRPEEDYRKAIRRLEAALLQEDHPICVRMTEAVGCLYSLWYQEREKLAGWLRYTLMDSTVRINEENYMMFFCRAKGYLLLNQYDRAGKILKKLTPYLQLYRRSRFLAEILFEYAIVNLWESRRGQSVRNAVASFLVTGNSRYVEFYAGYGEKGLEVLEAYEEWMHTNSPESWRRKKKYNYGNVLRMPMEDYVGVVLRCARRETRSSCQTPKDDIETRLTMMETIILQDIGRGFSNAEICEELNLKLSTVKSHIYSLYKKLGVDSRTQAVLKGKELGVLD